MKTKICQIIAIVFCATSVFSQDIHFSQFNMSPLTLNPGLAGVNYTFEALVNYKDQWRGVTTPYKTVAASVDSRIGKKELKESFWAGGVSFFNDRAGEAKIGLCQINATIAYHLRIAPHQTLGLGLQGGYAQRSINYNKLQWASQFDPNTGYDPNLPSGEPVGMTNFSYGDAGAGIIWALNNTTGLIHVEDNHDLKANLGIAVYHAKQKYSFYNTSTEKLYPKYVFHGDALISVPNFHNIALLPGIVFFNQGPAREFYFGTQVRYKYQQESKYTGIKKSAALYLGAYCRAKDAVILSFMLEYYAYSFGISYDLNASRLTPASTGRGGIELSVRYAIPSEFQKVTVKTSKILPKN